MILGWCPRTDIHRLHPQLASQGLAPLRCDLGLRRRARDSRRPAHQSPPAESWYILSSVTVYGGRMTKRLIELDDELLADAQRELHTEGVSDTVRAALRQAAASAARARQVEWLTDGGLESMAAVEQRTAAWR
jgi:Arc/MetJ family transcription regulator